MKAFMDKEFMLQSPTAQHLYHAYAEDMPICDYHCHIPPREIYENSGIDIFDEKWKIYSRNPVLELGALPIINENDTVATDAVPNSCSLILC